jgi:hypothetical protein
MICVMEAAARAELSGIELHSQTITPTVSMPPVFMEYLANTYIWIWSTQRKPNPPANSTILTHEEKDQRFQRCKF